MSASWGKGLGALCDEESDAASAFEALQHQKLTGERPDAVAKTEAGRAAAESNAVLDFTFVEIAEAGIWQARREGHW